MAATDPSLDILLDGKKAITDLCTKEDFLPAGKLERQFPLNFQDGYITIDPSGPTDGNVIDKIIAEVPAGSEATLEIQYDDLGFDSILTLLDEMRADYEAHIGDIAYHPVIDDQNTLESSINIRPVTLAQAIALSIELKNKLNLHLADAALAIPVYHAATGTSLEVISPDPTDTPTLLTLVNELKADFNTHISDAVAHTVADIANEVTSPDAAALGNLTFELPVAKTTVWSVPPQFGRYINRVRMKTNSTTDISPFIRIYTLAG
jgi:hypothetical protein